jgi:hypothetical protein
VRNGLAHAFSPAFLVVPRSQPSYRAIAAASQLSQQDARMVAGCMRHEVAAREWKRRCQAKHPTKAAGTRLFRAAIKAARHPPTATACFPYNIPQKARSSILHTFEYTAVHTNKLVLSCIPAFSYPSSPAGSAAATPALHHRYCPSRTSSQTPSETSAAV